MKRRIALCTSLVLLAGCGMVGGANRFLPQMSPAQRLGGNPIRVPHGNVSVSTSVLVSGKTKSVTVAVNGRTAQTFNTTVTTKGCKAATGGTSCSFKVAAPVGTDTFAIAWFAGTGGSGSVQHKGNAVVSIGATNPSVSFGPAVTNNKDTGVGSLRWAAGASSPGNTVMFFLANGTKITLASVITLSFGVSIAGPGSANLSISGNDKAQIFYIKAGVTSTIAGLTLAHGNASVAHTPGGAVYNLGVLTLIDDVLTGNTSVVTTIKRAAGRHHARHAHHKLYGFVKLPPVKSHVRMHPNIVCGSEYGGALYNDGTLTIVGSTFSGNVIGCLGGTGYGGAIYNDQYGILNVSSSTFSGNAAYYGGAVYNNSTYGQATFTKVTFTGNKGCTSVNGCPTSGCGVGSTCSGYAYGDGGAIYDNDGPGITVTSSTFTNNVVGGTTPGSEGYGGAIDVESGSPVITGSTFTSNLAGGGSDNCSYAEGGAIYESADGPLELDNDTFTGNKAGGDQYGYGGAIYNNNEPDQGSGNTFKNNTAIGSGSNCYTNSYAYGGALYSYYGLNMSNSTFTGNVATAAKYAEAGAFFESDPSTLSHDTFTNNMAIGTGVTDQTTSAEGGAWYNDDDLNVSNSTFTGNAAKALGYYGDTSEGGAGWVNQNLVSTGNLFQANEVVATYPSSADGKGYGGAIYGNDNIISKGDTFKANRIDTTYEADGGAVYNDGYQQSYSGDTFDANVDNAPDSYGGAYYGDESSSVVQNSNFTNNVAGTSTITQVGFGGAIYDDAGEHVNGSTFSGNTAVTAGGALYSNAANTVNNSTFTNNKVTAAGPYYGGGAWYSTSSDTVANSVFTGNSVAVAAFNSGGGAIYVNSGLTMDGSTLNGNKSTGSAPNSGGGAIFFYDSATITNSTFTGNSSSTDGGAFHEYSNYTIDLINSTVYQNKASNRGGNIFNPYTMYLYNTIVAGGSAASGKDVYNLGTFTSDDYNLIQNGVTGTFTKGAHDIIGKDPKLLVLASNGGPTQTNADTSTSPGKAYIPWAAGVCGGASSINVDQRNFARGAGGKCDIGAYELNGVAGAARHVALTPTRGHHGPRQPLQKPQGKPKYPVPVNAEARP